MKNLILGACALSCTTLATATAAAPGSANAEIAAIVAEVSAARIEAQVRKLVSFGTRHTLSDTKDPKRGIGAARDWIKSELERCAADSGGRLEVAFDAHTVPRSARVPDGARVVNVVATLPGTQAGSRERVYLVSGHYDSRALDRLKMGSDPNSDFCRADAPVLGENGV